MQVQLQKPELQQFIDEQIRAGNFASAEDIVELALTLLMSEDVELTEEDLAEIELSRQEIERGECVELSEFAARMRQKFGIA